MRQVFNRRVRDFFANLMSLKIGKNNYEPGLSKLIKKDELDEHVSNLVELGVTEFKGKIDPQIVKNIKEYLKKLKCHDPYRSDLGDFSIEDVPITTHTAHYHRADLVQNDDIMKIANDAGILSIVQAFLKAKPTISNVNAWWSFSGREKAEHAQLFHRDLDDYRFCKLFIYLTDVTSDSGPHIFVKNSSNSNKLSKIRRYSDDEIGNSFGKENILEFVRPEGSFFMVNTYGFHKGLLPLIGNRLLLQIQYSLNPIEIETYEPVALLNDSEFKNYTNRLLIK